MDAVVHLSRTIERANDKPDADGSPPRLVWRPISLLAHSMPGAELARRRFADDVGQVLSYGMRTRWERLASLGCTLGLCPRRWGERRAFHFLFNDADSYNAAEQHWPDRLRCSIPLSSGWHFAKLKVVAQGWTHRVIVIKHEQDAMTRQPQLKRLLEDLARTPCMKRLGDEQVDLRTGSFRRINN